MSTVLTLIKGYAHTGKTSVMIQELTRYVEEHKDTLLQEGKTHVLLAGMEGAFYKDASGEAEHRDTLVTMFKEWGFTLTWHIGSNDTLVVVDWVADENEAAAIGLDNGTPFTVGFAESIVEQANIPTFMVQQLLTEGAQLLPPLSIDSYIP